MNKNYLITLIVLAVLMLETHAKNYLVAPNGNDKNSGTSLKGPFATIKHAVSVMKAGDTCYIRGGTYQETIDLSGKAGVEGKPITLRTYKGERVIINGTKKITAKWVLDEGKVYKTKISQDVFQLFVDDELMTLARFPNAKPFSQDVWDRHISRCSKTPESKNGHVIDGGVHGKAIAGIGESLNGCIALLNFGAHATGSRVVENHKKGSPEFDYSPELFKYKTTRHFFVEGGIGNAERVLLDSEEEWAYDETSKILYLWAPNGKNPNGRNIRGKVQTYAIKGDAKTKQIVIDGLEFFATTFSFESSDHITIQNCKFNYYASSKRSAGVLGPSQTAQFLGTETDPCSDLTIYNCEFKYADASALWANNVDNLRIENNLFSNIDYACVNNDTGVRAPFKPSSTIRIDRSRDLVYRRNTLSTCGNAQGLSANRLYEGKDNKRFNPEAYQPASVRSITCEYNFHTACGLLHTDGSSLYIPEASAMESLISHNWFIGNGQRDFRWDGNNKPLNGVKGNIFRNVAVGLKNKRLAPGGGNGYRLKGSYHEVYNNIGLGHGGELNVADEKGGNDDTKTVNNAASTFTSNPIPGKNSHNFAGSKQARQLSDMLRDPNNWDFRPKSDASELIDKGMQVTCSVKDKTIDVTKGFIGKAPDIGAYEYGDKVYWIPGRQESKASMPVPRNMGKNVKLDSDLMYLIGLKGVKTKVYLGQSANSLSLVSTQSHPENIIKLSDRSELSAKKTYHWRVDTLLADGSVVKGEVWSFTTAAK